MTRPVAVERVAVLQAAQHRLWRVPVDPRLHGGGAHAGEARRASQGGPSARARRRAAAAAARRVRVRALPRRLLLHGARGERGRRTNGRSPSFCTAGQAARRRAACRAQRGADVPQRGLRREVHRDSQLRHRVSISLRTACLPRSARSRFSKGAIDTAPTCVLHSPDWLLPRSAAKAGRAATSWPTILVRCVFDSCPCAVGLGLTRFRLTDDFLRIPTCTVGRHNATPTTQGVYAKTNR